MKPTTIEINPAAMTATIDTLWGEGAVAVVNRVYGVINRIATQHYEQGMADGEAKGQKNATAPSAIEDPELCYHTSTPMTPKDLYGDEMWDPTKDFLIQHDSGDEQPDSNKCCAATTALCADFPGCGCIA